jgi:formate dehydrogenase subunit gamma
MRMTTARVGHGHKIIKWFVATVLLVLVLPLVPYVFDAYADKSAAPATTSSVPSPGAELWRAVRQRDGIVSGTTQARGVDAGTLINPAGEEWREYRVTKLVPYSAYIFGAMLAVFLIYYLVRGRIRIKGGRSGVLIPRFSLYARWVHWVGAVSFMVLAFTGLVLLYGRFILIPVLGAEGFGVTASVGKWLHDVTSPLFIVALIFMIFTFLKESLINFKVDMMWFLRAGGYLGGKHPSAEKVNAGQKLWYWAVALGGLAIVASGLVMYFPNFEQGRQLIQDSHMIHTLASVFVISFMIVHIYLASFGVEGALECMTTGYCDSNWAKEHHDLWYEEMEKEGKIGTTFESEQQAAATASAKPTEG